MAAAKQTAITPRPKRTMPNPHGVPGKLVDPPADVQFGGGAGRVSPYAVLLEQLIPARGKVLEFGDLRARSGLFNRAKKLGMRVLFGEKDGRLYVKFAGWLPGSERWKAEARAAIRDVITTQPRNEIQVAVAVRSRGINDIEAADVGAILKQMEQTGETVRQRDGSWGLKP